MSIKRWIFPQIDINKAQNIANECKIDLNLAKILLARGFETPADVEKFLRSDSEIPNPFELKDMQKGVDALEAALKNNEKITIFGDYDVDGITSTAIIYLYLKSLNANVDFITANRADGGYGLNFEIIEELKNRGTKLLITVDNGISSAAEIAVAYNEGIKVIVTDHHETPEILPQCEAIINPKQADCNGFSEICGALVILKFVAAHAVYNEHKISEIYDKYADFAALATIADICPLVAENRQIVVRGLEILNKNPKSAFKYIINRAMKGANAITAEDLAFYITPKLNAAGRMGDASRAVKMLVSDDENEIINLADEILAENERRRDITEEYTTRVLADLKDCDGRVKVACLRDIPEGIVGIVAARVTEIFGAPSVILGESDDGTATGSARSIKGFSIYGAVKSAEEILLRYGGHNQAAGLTINTENFAQLKQKINDYAQKNHEIMPFEEIYVDFNLSARDLNFTFCDMQKLLEPIGSANPRPIFCLQNTMLTDVAPTSTGKHLKLHFCKDSTKFTLMKFGTTADEFNFKKGDKLDLCVNLSKGEFRGQEQLDIRLIDIRAAEFAQEKVLQEVRLFEAFTRDENPQIPADLVPNRDDFINFFKFLSANPHVSNINANELALRLNRPDDYFKTAAMINIFNEVGIISLERANNRMNIQLCENPKKADLDSAPTMIKLKAR